MDLERLPAAVARLAYDRKALRPRLAHLGFGAFARAHVLAYLDAANAGGGDWGARVLRLRSDPAEMAAFSAAGHLYTHVARDGHGVAARVIGTVCDALHPGLDGWPAVISGLAAPEIEVITLTITEMGYCLRDGRLEHENPAVAADLDGAAPPVTAPGLLVAALAARRASGGGHVTLVSCDNLPENGRLLAASVTDLAAARDPDLAEWIATHAAFPSTMVDRITPAMTPADHDGVTALLGQPDPQAVVTEPFSQWVIQDRFAAARPPWERAGAQIVADVRPFEEMKLRMLNGSHSFLAYLGLAAGIGTIAEAVAHPALGPTVAALMRTEAAPTLAPGLDTSAYATALMTRFANPALRHRLDQIATDGSQKLPQRTLAPIAVHLGRGTPWPRLALTVAGWAHHVRREGRALRDPLAERLGVLADSHRAGFLPALLAERAVFPEALTTDPRFTAGIADAFAALENGIPTALERLA